MKKSELKINEQSIKTELKAYKDKPYKCIFEYIWNSFDAGSTEVCIDYDIPREGIGFVQNLQINDNGKGWDFEDHAITNNFISSTKKPIKDKTLPKGQYGRGRYAFIWIAKKIEVYSKKKKLTLQHDTDILKENSDTETIGTNIKFINIGEELSYILLDLNNLHQEIIFNFGWFLLENENYKIKVNGEEVNVNNNIKDTKVLTKVDFNDDIQEKVDESFEIKIVLWNQKPSEYSKYYFLNENGTESFKQNTGLNKKSDNFWHSVYIKSKLFKSIEDTEEDNQINDQKIMDFNDKELKKTKKQILEKIKKELVLLRKPYLIEQSNYLLKGLKEDNIMPNLNEFGIYDEESYDELLKTIYTISPSLFVNKSDSEKKFICATFAGLLSNQDDTLIKTILEQLQELSEEEKRDLLDILNRSSLSSVIKTIKEIDHRLDVIDKLKVLISEHEKETLEVKHIQKILDKNFWLFGEQFRLFSTTEGALKNVLMKYAKEILNIEEPELNTQPNGEVDLFLTKTETIGEKIQKNIVVEIKRASKKITKKEYDQLEGYMEKIIEQNICNGENQYWEFYLIGKNFDDHIRRKIDSAKNHGEKERGLCLNSDNGRVKIYVRKWSDVLEVEWGTKMRYLKEKLEIQSKKIDADNPDTITQKLTINR